MSFCQLIVLCSLIEEVDQQKSCSCNISHSWTRIAKTLFVPRSLQNSYAKSLILLYLSWASKRILITILECQGTRKEPDSEQGVCFIPTDTLELMIIPDSLLWFLHTAQRTIKFLLALWIIWLVICHLLHALLWVSMLKCDVVCVLGETVNLNFQKTKIEMRGTFTLIWCLQYIIIIINFYCSSQTPQLIQSEKTT